MQNMPDVESDADLVQFYDVDRRFTTPFGDLGSGGSRLYAVYGGPDAGKTTLLHYIAHQLKQRDTPIFIPVYVDCQIEYNAGTSADDTLEWLIEQIRAELKGEPYKLCALLDNLFDRFRHDHDPLRTFSDAFSHIRELSKRHIGDGLRDVQFVALLDNADALAEAEVAVDVFSRLHALLRGTRFFDVVMAGSDALYDRLNEPNCIWRDDAVSVELSCFEPAEAKAFLNAQTDARLPAHISLMVYAFSGGHPALLQGFLERLRDFNDEYWEEVTAEMVVDAAEELIEAVDIWYAIKQSDAQLEQQAYRLLLDAAPGDEHLATMLNDTDESATIRTLDAFSNTGQSTHGLADLIDTILREVDDTISSESWDWHMRLDALEMTLPALYHLLQHSCSSLRKYDFRKALANAGDYAYSYQRALDRLQYMGVVHVLPRKQYVLGGHIFFEQFRPLTNGTSGTDVYGIELVQAERLLEKLGREHALYPDALTQKDRLEENVGMAREYGDHEQRRAERTEIRSNLNQISLDVFGVPLDEL